MPTDLSGFTVATVDLPRPAVPVSDECRGRLASVIAAMLHGQTPEDIAGYLSRGFPDSVAAALGRPHERDEVNDFIDLLLVVQQTVG